PAVAGPTVLEPPRHRLPVVLEAVVLEPVIGEAVIREPVGLAPAPAPVGPAPVTVAPARAPVTVAPVTVAPVTVEAVIETAALVGEPAGALVDPGHRALAAGLLGELAHRHPADQPAPERA